MPAEDYGMDDILEKLEKRFAGNAARHANLSWESVRARIAERGVEEILARMEESGGEPDVIYYDAEADRFWFVDCAKESPAGRRSLCYDGKALTDRKENKPRSSAVDKAREIGVTLLTEAEYRMLQEREEFDVKTSSWLLTPSEIREAGGAIFGDRRYNTVFVYHNGADSYYAARGFRGILKI